MHFQTLSSPHLNLKTTFRSSFDRFSVPFFQADSYTPLLLNSRSKNRFCSARKMVSTPHIILRSHEISVGIRCESDREKDAGFYMRKSVEIARKAIGCTSPNPMVGCVIVKDGQVVGEGFHPKAGQPHAEVFALREAGELAENATAYVSLEPCNHYGRTPPCTEALIRAKVKRVIVGMVDPNPIVASKGVEKLRASGIEVKVGVEEELCKKLNEAYIHKMLTGKPFVTLRYSLSVNGRLSNQLAEGAKEAGGYYSQLLQEYDGVIVSSGAVTRNSSFPTSQEAQAKQPLQIIVAKSLNSPIELPSLAAEAASQVIVFTEGNTAVDPEIARQGIETVILDQLHLDTILDYCGQRGLCSVLLDLRGSCGDFEDLLEDGIRHNLFQKVVMEVLPIWDNSKNTSTLPLKNLEEKLVQLKTLESRLTKESVLVIGYF